MAVIEMFSWWYISGWRMFISKVQNYFTSIADFFSMDSLIRTLFKPYRQISAETSSGPTPLNLKFQMFLDRSISRLVGFISRLFLLLAGIIIMIIGGIFSLILIILWPIIPLLPFAGIILSILKVAI